MRVLAIGHSASRTGAPILLLHLLRTLKRSGSVDLRCVLARTGPLLDDYRMVCDTYVPCEPLYRRMPARIARKLGGVFASRDPFRAWIRSTRPDVIYANSIASIPVLRKVRAEHPETPFVLHVHELTWLLRREQDRHKIASEILAADRVIVVSRAVLEAITQEFSLPPNRTELVYEYVCQEQLSDASVDRMRIAMREKHGVSQDETACLSVGTQEWRKGAELIPAIARECAALGSKVKFFWVGGETNDRSLLQMTLDAERAGVADRVTFVGEVDDPKPWFAMADVFALPSREDPFPLAMLEAASFGLPIVAFRNSGGADEFVSKGAGVSVPYLDLAAFAGAVAELAGSSSMRLSMGAKGAEQVLESHQLDDAAARLRAMLQRLSGVDES